MDEKVKKSLWEILRRVNEVWSDTPEESGQWQRLETISLELENLLERY